MIIQVQTHMERQRAQRSDQNLFLEKNPYFSIVLRHSQQKYFPTLFSMNRIFQIKKTIIWKFCWHETRWKYLEVAVTSCQKYHTLVDFQSISENESADKLTLSWRITKRLSKMSTANDLCGHLIKLVTEWTTYFAYELVKELY